MILKGKKLSLLICIQLVLVHVTASENEAEIPVKVYIDEHEVVPGSSIEKEAFQTFCEKHDPKKSMWNFDDDFKRLLGSKIVERKDLDNTEITEVKGLTEKPENVVDMLTTKCVEEINGLKVTFKKKIRFTVLYKFDTSLLYKSESFMKKTEFQTFCYDHIVNDIDAGLKSLPGLIFDGEFIQAKVNKDSGEVDMPAEELKLICEDEITSLEIVFKVDEPIKITNLDKDILEDVLQFQLKIQKDLKDSSKALGTKMTENDVLTKKNTDLEASLKDLKDSSKKLDDQVKNLKDEVQTMHGPTYQYLFWITVVLIIGVVCYYYFAYQGKPESAQKSIEKKSQ